VLESAILSQGISHLRRAAAKDSQTDPGRFVHGEPCSKPEWEMVISSTYRHIACLSITTLRGQHMAVDACFPTYTRTELARLRHLFDRTERAIDGRADVVCLHTSAAASDNVRVRGLSGDNRARADFDGDGGSLSQSFSPLRVRRRRTFESGASISLATIRLVALVVGERASREFSDAACHVDRVLCER
jgi:hypothetical protein